MEGLQEATHREDKPALGASMAAEEEASAEAEEAATEAGVTDSSREVIQL